MWLRCVVTAALASATLLGCATIQNQPVNVARSGPLEDPVMIGFEDPAYLDDLLVGLAFSGGGTRAAAFSFGVLTEMAQMRMPRASDTLVERIDFISGVSGGSVTAAYFGLHKRAALTDFRERFLLRNAEEGLDTSVGLGTAIRAFSGGVNDSRGFPRWLDANLFNGATFAEFRVTRRPRVWINASDIYNRTPFVFGATAFGAICSNLLEYPIANAVAASAAVPLAFAPVVIQTFPGQCRDPLPAWVVSAANNRNASPMLSAFAKGITRYRAGEVPYIKLLDGGLVDNYGLSGFTISRESSDAPYGPLTPEQAVKLRRGVFVVVDARNNITGDWVRTVEGPAGVDLIKAVSDTALDASVGASYTAFERTMSDWQGALVRWRCGLSATERARYGARPGWNCRDMRFFIGRAGFDQLDPGRAVELDQIPTSFRLPQPQVDAVIAAGRDAIRANTAMRGFLNSL